MPAGYPFSFGGPHAVFPSCKHLPPPAYACISLDVSASLCILLCSPAHLGGQNEVSSQRAASRSSWCPHWEADNSDEARLAGGCARSVCSEAVRAVCPIYIFLIMLPPAQVPLAWNRQVFLQRRSVLIVLLGLAQRACIWGACPRAQTTKALSLIYFLNIYSKWNYIIYFIKYIYISYCSQPSSSSGRMRPRQQDLCRGVPVPGTADLVANQFLSALPKLTKASIKL